MKKDVSVQAKVGTDAVVAYFQSIKLPDRLGAFDETVDVRTDNYVKQQELKKAQHMRVMLIENYNNIPAVIELRKQLLEQKKRIHEENPNPMGGIIPRIPPDGSMSTAYKKLLNDFHHGRKVYESVALVEVEVEINALQEELEGMNMRVLEQKEWTAGRSEKPKK